MKKFFLFFIFILPSISISQIFETEEFYIKKIESFTTIEKAEVVAEIKTISGKNINKVTFRVFIKNKDFMVMSPISSDTQKTYTLKNKLIIFAYFHKYKRLKNILLDETLRDTSSLLSILNINIKDNYIKEDIFFNGDKVVLILKSDKNVLFPKIKITVDKHSGKPQHSVYYYKDKPYYFVNYVSYKEIDTNFIINNYKIDLIDIGKMIIVDVQIKKINVSFPDIYFNKNYLDKVVIE